MVEQTNAVKAFELVYILVGYMGTMAGVVLSILFIAYHGEKFGDKAISIEDANGDITKYNGPKEEYLVYLWLLTVATCIALFSNVLGPCSFGRRLHIPGQFGAVCIGGCYLAVSTAISAEWPAEVPFDPHRYFFFAGFCMFSGQCVCFFGAIIMQFYGHSVIPSTPKTKGKGTTLFGKQRARYTYLANNEEDDDATI